MVRMNVTFYALISFLYSSVKVVYAGLDDINRIVGGTDVPVDTYPWFVSFGGCGGTLISPEYVLSAGKVNIVIIFLFLLLHQHNLITASTISSSL